MKLVRNDIVEYEGKTWRVMTVNGSIAYLLSTFHGRGEEPTDCRARFHECRKVGEAK